MPQLRGTAACMRSGARFFPSSVFLCAEGVTSVRDVTSATISALQTWGKAVGYNSAARDPSALGRFFEWLIFDERYEGENPVIPSFHRKKVSARVGRPYSDRETADMRGLLEERGNERLRGFFELACKSDRKSNELCRLK